MPTLLTRISTSPNCAISPAQPSAPPRSNTAACSFADGDDFLIFAMASLTAACSRPLTMTSAPICASPVAEASPMPRVEPVTSARLPVRSRSMRSPKIPMLFDQSLFRRRHDKYFPGDRRTRMPAEETLRRDRQLLKILAVFLHPGFADRQPAIGSIADTDKAETFCLLERGEP